MNFRPRNAFILSLVAAVLVGATVSAHYLAQGFIGLDPSAFPAGETFQSIGRSIFPSLNISVGGLVLALGSLLRVGVLAGFRYLSPGPAILDFVDALDAEVARLMERP